MPPRSNDDMIQPQVFTHQLIYTGLYSQRVQSAMTYGYRRMTVRKRRPPMILNVLAIFTIQFMILKEIRGVRKLSEEGLIL